MDLLTQAAQSVFNGDNDEELCIPLTPTKGVQYTPPKGERAAFTEITNTINISPDKFNNSPLQALFNAPTLCTPKTKARNLINIVNSNGTRNVGRGSGGKSVSSPTTGSEVGTPKQNGVPPCVTNSGGSGRSPLTPMTNLKLLTRIASMEESLSMSSKKVLFEKENICQDISSSKGVTSHSSSTLRRRYNSECLGQSENNLTKERRGVLRKHPTSDNYPPPSSPGNLVLEALGHISSVDETIAARPPELSRKDKSLGLLSEKFLEQFPLEVSFLETPRRLVIDEVATLLGTERRRVYDIINVLESVNMATRVQKNMYQWTGKLHLEETLGRLKALGEKYDIAHQLHALKNEDSKEFKVPQQIKLTRIGDSERDVRKENCLSILCQKFLMILLVSPQPHIISLDNAIRLLVGEVGESGDRLRARGRRLYDIANVLTSLGLVRRIPAAKAFQYIGPAVESVVNDDDTFGIVQRNSLLPSRRVMSSEGKENVNNYGDHEVTPSDVAPPVQKRGRPRKLATAFTSSTLPAPKRSRLQRTRSEDVISSNSRKLTRNPSLHDICQVAEVEREKLMREQSRRSQSSDGFESGCGRSKRVFSFGEPVVLPNSDFRPISSEMSSSILQRRLSKRGKIPIALTFQNSDQEFEQKRALDTQCISSSKENRLKPSECRVMHMQRSNSLPCHNPKPVKCTMDQKCDLLGPSRISAPERCPTVIVPHSRNVIQHCSSQGYNNQVQPKSPVIIVKGNSVGARGFSHSRVVPVSESISQGAQVIKVITKTTASKEQDASTIMTVLPANASGKPIAMQPKLTRKSSGCFQHVSEGVYTNGQKITVSSSSSLVGSNRNMMRQNSIEGNASSSFVVFTVSDNQAGQKTFMKVPRVSGFSGSFQQPGNTHNPNQFKVNEQIVNGISSLTSAPLQFGKNLEQESSVIHGNERKQQTTIFGKRNNFSGDTSWQPSPDGSSTDSELEQIFGDTFSFPRPKTLIMSNTNTQAFKDKS